MRLRKVKGADEIIQNSAYVIQNPTELRGQWNTNIFENDAPIYLEIGMGKGRFIREQAISHPDCNYIGMEKESSVLFRAVLKEEEEPLPNLRFLCVNAEILPEIFAENEIAGIFLNFSDPWPKDRHAKRRLTYREYLKKYAMCLKKDGILEFKTDNLSLFTFSLEEFSEEGWRILGETRDLSKSSLCEGNIETEYEMRFKALGNPICKLMAAPPLFH